MRCRHRTEEGWQPERLNRQRERNEEQDKRKDHE